VPADTFADDDAGDRLSYRASQANGAALPGWLAFDPATATFSGTPLNENVGVLHLKVTATDSANASVDSLFTVKVANINHAPTVAHAIADQAAVEDAAFHLTAPADTFADSDEGDTLSYSASLADGSPLPAWLSFNPATRVFSGTPLNENVGVLNLKLTATDSGNAQVADVFKLTVANTNDAPTAIALSNNTVAENAANGTLVGTLSAIDPDLGDTHSYQLLDNAAGRFVLSGNQLFVANNGLLDYESRRSHSITVETTDAAGLSYTQSLTINLSNVDEAPTDISLSSSSVDENSLDGTVVGLLSSYTKLIWYFEPTPPKMSCKDFFRFS